MSVAAEDEKASFVVGEKIAERVDRQRMQRRRKRRRIVLAAVAIEARSAARGAVDAARAGIDDQPLPRVRMGDRGVAQRMIVAVAVLSRKLLELIPARFLVREPDTPLDVDERAGIAAAFDAIAAFDRTSVRRRVVVPPHFKAPAL